MDVGAVAVVAVDIVAAVAVDIVAAVVIVVVSLVPRDIECVPNFLLNVENPDYPDLGMTRSRLDLRTRLEGLPCLGGYTPLTRSHTRLNL